MSQDACHHSSNSDSNLSNGGVYFGLVCGSEMTSLPVSKFTLSNLTCADLLQQTKGTDHKARTPHNAHVKSCW